MISQASLLTLPYSSPSHPPDLLCPPSMLELCLSHTQRLSLAIPQHSTSLSTMLCPLQEILFHVLLCQQFLFIFQILIQASLPPEILWGPFQLDWCSSYVNTMSLTVTLHQNGLFVYLSLPGDSKLHEGKTESASLLHASAFCITQNTLKYLFSEQMNVH